MDASVVKSYQCIIFLKIICQSVSQSVPRRGLRKGFFPSFFPHPFFPSRRDETRGEEICTHVIAFFLTLKEARDNGEEDLSQSSQTQSSFVASADGYARRNCIPLFRTEVQTDSSLEQTTRHYYNYGGWSSYVPSGWVGGQIWTMASAEMSLLVSL
jgi:hypothetical protein